MMKDKLAFEGRARANELEECDHEALAWHAAVLEAKLAAAREVLREFVKWCEFEVDLCPICDEHLSRGHAPDCKLAALLEETDG